MAEFTMDEILEMQRILQDKYKDKWEPICPETGKNKLLWMIGEIGEVADIVKKHGHEKAISYPQLRSDLVEEMADVLMYYNDVLLRYHVTAEEIADAYRRKHAHNMGRDYRKQYEEMYRNG